LPQPKTSCIQRRTFFVRSTVPENAAWRILRESRQAAVLFAATSRLYRCFVYNGKGPVVRPPLYP
jgi:hypothetical protein